MKDDEWMRAAMADDSLVAELLLRLKRHPQDTPAEAEAAAARPFAVAVRPFAVAAGGLPPLDWGLRQPRSKPALRCAATSTSAAATTVVHSKKEQLETAGGSPTTPLSWSGGNTASPSATADAEFEESSRLEIRSSTARSKGQATIDASSGSTGRRLRRKKTFHELKEEEGQLLKERKHLRKEIAALRATVKEQRDANARLKRMKLDIDIRSEKLVCSNSAELGKVHPCQPHAPAFHTSSALPAQNFEDSAAFDSCRAQEVVETEDSFLLPDLNMVPSEEDFGIAAVSVMS